ncbi:hypothetical protein [Pragia fontium]|uniref:hypothetical protein n=1 Tax=Pragia fontium TaxID=82985 RepID=UPI000649E760|nr:hypothetical protein [Pragia fontium]AKJ41763.1 hypothetical protein QQ39_06420 [Pragia fontium]
MNLKLNADSYHSALVEMARCAIRDRIALIDAHYTNNAEYKTEYLEVKSDCEKDIADFEKIKIYALKKIKG